jgi:hypothetical protein
MIYLAKNAARIVRKHGKQCKKLQESRAIVNNLFYCLGVVFTGATDASKKNR